MRKAGERVRITAQLIETASGCHLWADRYDRALDDIFAVQDEVVATIAATLAGRIQAAGVEQAKRKPTTDLAAYECCCAGSSGSPPRSGSQCGRAPPVRARRCPGPGLRLAHAYLALAIFSEELGDAAAEARVLPRTCLARGVPWIRARAGATAFWP